MKRRGLQAQAQAQAQAQGNAQGNAQTTARALAVAALALWAACSASAAIASEALSDQHGCSNCHLVDKKLVGPAFKAVGERYRGRPDAAVLLAAKVSQGGAGVWGAAPMPAMAHVPPEDVRALVAWILKP